MDVHEALKKNHNFHLFNEANSQPVYLVSLFLVKCRNVERKGSPCENIAVIWFFQQQNNTGSSTSMSQLPCSSETMSCSTWSYSILTFHILGSAWVFLHRTWLVSLLISCLQQAAFHMAFLFSSRPRSKWERSGLSARSSFSAVGLWRVGCPEKNRTMDKII